MPTQTPTFDLTALINSVARLSEGLATFARDNSDIETIPAFLRDAIYRRDQLQARQP